VTGVILAVDSGTTSTRVWRVVAGEVAEMAAAPVGARDVALDQDGDGILRRLRVLADEALEHAGDGWSSVEAIVAFGMITSELGLEEIPHLQAPVDRRALARGLVRRRYADMPQPVFLVPGVRSHGESLETIDFMRGEETEVVGVLELGEVEPPFLYLSTGSHSKFVSLDPAGRIAWSLTTLSGELLWALHRETILAGLVAPTGAVESFGAVERGAALAERSGLSRALFAARLLHRVEGESPERCADFLHGAVAAADLGALRRRLEAEGVTLGRVAVGGAGRLAEAYRHLLERAGVGELRAYREALGPLGAWSLYVAAQAEAERAPGAARGG
jgi:2-dehydro-3-deoxygalactonokinase